MSLIDRLEKQAKWHKDRIWVNNMYFIAQEDARALLQEAADRIKGLQLLVDQQKQINRA